MDVTYGIKNACIFSSFSLKKNEYTNKKVVILYAYPCIGPKKSPFWQNKYTKDGCEDKKPSHRRKTVFCVFVYRTCVSGQRNHSLSTSRQVQKSHMVKSGIIYIYIIGFDYMYTEWVRTHLHFRIEFLFFGTYLYVFLYTWAQGGVCFLWLKIFFGLCYEFAVNQVKF